MKVCLLAESKMIPVPEDIEVVMDFGNVDIITKTRIIHGNHIIINGSEDAIKNWLRPFDGVWLSVGAPQNQEFEIKHIRG